MDIEEKAEEESGGSRSVWAGFPSYFKSARKGSEAGRGRTISGCRGMSLCSRRCVFSLLRYLVVFSFMFSFFFVAF